jgi:hypothetical protein
MCGRYQLNADFFNRLGLSQKFAKKGSKITHLGDASGDQRLLALLG